ncbi:MAG: hypothetical protein LBI69_02025 [Puniceicoccales bacterium]|nr:hypothetical protein [Puniceicoccales bacterium]
MVDRRVAIPDFDKFKVPNCEFPVDNSVCCARIFGKAIAGKCLLIISSDLSHYLPANAAQRYDNKTIGHLLGGAFPPRENCLKNFRWAVK